MKGLFIGTTTIDIIYPIDAYPEEDSKIHTSGYRLYLGGPATNAAITFAALGGEATLISPVGTSTWTPLIKERLNQYHVAHMDLAANDHFEPTLSSILVNAQSGLRTVITAKAKTLQLNQLQDAFSINDFAICCLDGFHADVALKVLENKSDSVPVIFDGGSYKDKTDLILKWVDYPIFSERFTLPHNQPLPTILSDEGIKHYAVTRGFRPIEVFENGIRSELPIPTVKAIDTLGAGDIFHGAFAWFILETKGHFIKALEKSINIASHSCQYPGPREWIKHR